MSLDRPQAPRRPRPLLGRGWAEAWLLLLPSVVLFATFTHVPILRTLVDSFHSTPKGARPAFWASRRDCSM